MSEDKQKTILIGEDEIDLNSALCTVLTDEGYRVITTYNGEETLEKFSEETPDFILLDIHMPKKTGIEVLGEIRQTEEGKSIPVTIFTATGTMGAVSDAMEVGGMNTDFFTKSEFSLDQIVERVKSRLD